MIPAFPEGEVALGIDIGGTKIRFGLVQSSCDILYQYTLPTMAAERRVMEQVFRGIEIMLAAWEQRCEGRQLSGIGIGSAGQIDFSEGIVHYANDLIPGYTGTPVKAKVMQRFGLPVLVDNDVNVLALSESFFGAGKNASNMVCLALGTGVGGAVITGGSLVHGINGGAGEIGHLSVDWQGPRCMCGNIGCLELYASGTGILKRYVEKRALACFDPDGNDTATSDVIVRWQEGEPLAVEVMNDAIAALGTAITSLIHIFNPELIIIGGGIAGLGEPLLSPLRRLIESRSMPSMLSAVRVVTAELGEASNMVGAAIQVWVYS